MKPAPEEATILLPCRGAVIILRGTVPGSFSAIDAEPALFRSSPTDGTRAPIPDQPPQLAPLIALK
jgi:hypothetical protein